MATSFFVFCRPDLGQQTKIDVAIHSRVDTSKKEIKEIAALWVHYLSFCSLFEIKGKDINAFWRSEVLKFKRK